MKLPITKTTTREPATIEDVFARFLDRPWRRPFFPTLMPEEPAVDVYRQNGSVVVKAAIPGAKPGEVEARVDGDVLTLTREYHEEKEEKEKNYYYKEQEYGSFTREIRLPESVDADHAEAELKDGMLTITLPVAATPEKKGIPIKS